MSENCPYCEMTRDYFAIEDECCHEYEVNRLKDIIKRYRKALEAAPDIKNCAIQRHVEWYDGIRKEALEGDE